MLVELYVLASFSFELFIETQSSDCLLDPSTPLCPNNGLFFLGIKFVVGECS